MIAKPKHSLGKLLACVTFLAVVFAIVFSDFGFTLLCWATDSPVSCMRSSSPMKAHMACVWEHRDDPDLESSIAIDKLRSLIGDELSRESTETELKAHIVRHYRNPEFSVSGVPASRWEQHAYGKSTVLYPGSKMVRVAYFKRGGKFLFAQLIVGNSSLEPIALTEPIDFWDFSHLENSTSR